MRMRIGGERRMERRFESAMAIAKKNRDVRRTRVGYDEIWIAVAIHVRDGDVVWPFTAGEGRARCGDEISISTIEQHAEAGVVAVRNDEVGLAIVIDVGDRYEGGAFSDP